MEGWFDFLKARMQVIQSAREQGRSIAEIEELINIKGMQSTLLCTHADNLNQKERIINAKQIQS